MAFLLKTFAASFIFIDNGAKALYVIL